MTQFKELLKTLKSESVEFVVIGGVAANIHGVNYPTYDLDICYGRSQKNVERLVKALAPLHPTLRGAPKDLPFQFDVPTLKSGLNFTFDTDLGEIDILGEVGGVGFYEGVLAHAIDAELLGLRVLVLDIDALTKSKKHAGRKKDEPVILELEAIQELLKRKQARKA
ncbi:MAG: hypothetical protein HY961_12555 [Ignavibacteriae bacterium]|nr:hypothetical protein [Ignavibacteriota bacterium]